MIETQRNPSKNQKIQELVFEKINKMDRPQTRLIKIEKNQIDAIKMIKGIIPLIPQKYKLPSKNTINTSMQIN